jgi:hypothetical protein
MQIKRDFAGSTDMWPTSAGGQLIEVANLTGFTVYLTAVGLTPGGSSTSQIYTRTVHIIQRKENWEAKGKLGSADRAPSLRIIPWHLPYN